MRTGDKLDSTNTDGPGLWNGFYPHTPRTDPGPTLWRKNLRRAWELLAESADACGTLSARFDLAGELNNHCLSHLFNAVADATVAANRPQTTTRRPG